MSPGRRDPVLVGAVTTLLALLVVHALDHGLRQSAPVPAGASTLGTLGLAAAGVALALAAVGSRFAWPVAAVVALGTAAGFVAVHVLPDWGPFSQPYADIDVDALSWVNMIVPAAVALAVGLTAALRRPADRTAGV